MAERILFLDDSPERRRAAVKAMLARTCETADQAIALIAQQWDAIYLDHDLGGEQDDPTCEGPDGKTGMHVVDALASRGPRDGERIVLHSLNVPARAEMHARLRAPTSEYLLGYSSAVLRAARARAENEYRTTIDDCGDLRQAHHNAMDAVWTNRRGPKTRDALDRWTLEAQKEADEWSGMTRPVTLRTASAEDACSHAYESNPGMYDTQHRYCTKCGRAE